MEKFFVRVDVDIDTGITEKFSVAWMDVTEEFPFIVTKM